MHFGMQLNPAKALGATCIHISKAHGLDHAVQFQQIVQEQKILTKMYCIQRPSKHHPWQHRAALAAIQFLFAHLL